MKAKKTDPKSIRFNKKDLEIAMAKGNFESPQELVDCLLKHYVREDVGQDISDYEKLIWAKMGAEWMKEQMSS